MKKFLIATVVLLGSISFANAEQYRVGISLMGAGFEADGAKEIFSGDHSSNASSTKRTINASDEKDGAEGAFALASIFAEYPVNDEMSIGISYVPHQSTTEEAQNVQNQEAHAFSAEATNKVKVAFEDLVTIYALANLNDNVYGKLGIMYVELKTEENLGTGGAYPDDELMGFTVGLGYNMDLNDGMFVRGEVAYMEIDGTTLTNSNDSTKSVSADGVTGYGAAISVGKSF